jgi:hypothetical protein
MVHLKGLLKNSFNVIARSPKDDEAISNSLIYIKARLLRPDFIGTRNDAVLGFSTRPEGEHSNFYFLGSFSEFSHGLTTAIALKILHTHCERPSAKGGSALYLRHLC